MQNSVLLSGFQRVNVLVEHDFELLNEVWLNFEVNEPVAERRVAVGKLNVVVGLLQLLLLDGQDALNDFLVRQDSVLSRSFLRRLLDVGHLRQLLVVCDLSQLWVNVWIWLFGGLFDFFLFLLGARQLVVVNLRRKFVDLKPTVVAARHKSLNFYSSKA